jgi:hypothetical protein
MADDLVGHLFEEFRFVETFLEAESQSGGCHVTIQGGVLGRADFDKEVEHHVLLPVHHLLFLRRASPYPP